LVLAITVLGVGPASAAPGRAAATSRTAAGTTAAATPTTDATQRPDLVSAQLLARQRGHRVEITGLRSETTMTWANPDGTLTSEIASGPVRVKTSAGWRDIDLTLVADGGGVHPRVAGAGVRFSPGGSGDAAVASQGGRTVRLGWGGVLPVPRLAGAVASYPGVAPGVDLELEALADGFRQRLILRVRPQTAPVFRLPLVLAGGMVASVTADGQLAVRTAQGEPVVVADPPRMWGAERDPGSLEPTRQALVGMRVAGPVGAQVLLPTRPAPHRPTHNPPTSYTRATIHYINWDGRQVNQADPGGHITTTEYDPTGTGNTVRQLSAAYRAAALATGTTSQEHADRAANSTPRPLHP
jgi:hypothetical protein